MPWVGLPCVIVVFPYHTHWHLVHKTGLSHIFIFLRKTQKRKIERNFVFSSLLLNNFFCCVILLYEMRYNPSNGSEYIADNLFFGNNVAKPKV